MSAPESPQLNRRDRGVPSEAPGTPQSRSAVRLTPGADIEAVLAKAREGKATLTAAFFARAAAHPEKVAMRRKTLGLWEEVTWADYETGARRVAMALIDLGVQQGEPVGLISENRVEWLMTDLGILASGAVTCAMYTSSAAEQVEYVMGHAGIRFLFVENEEQLDKALAVRETQPVELIVVMEDKGLRNFKDPGIVFWGDFLRRGAEALEGPDGRGEEIELRSAANEPDDLAILVYTSGTTGPPKGVMLSHGNIAWICSTMAEVITPKPDDQLLSFLPLCHVAERIITVFNQVLNGSVVNFAENLDTVRENLAEVRPNIFFAVPRIWEKLFNSIELKIRDASYVKRKAYAWAVAVGREYNDYRRKGESAPLGVRLRHLAAEQTVLRHLREMLGFDRMRFALSGAAPISPEVIGYFQALGVPLVEGYGQTESAGVITVHSPGFVDPGTVGKALGNLELRIADDGEILARSPGVMLGYYKEAAATAETIDPEGWLHTGDIGEIDEAGCLRITDRKKDLIITAGGKNIAPQYIESKLRLSPYVHDAVVIGERRKYITALIILDEDNLVEWAQKARVQFGSYADLAKSPEVEKLIDDEIRGVNDALTHVEAVKKFRILEKRLDADAGELTPTLKVRRKFVEQKYTPLIEAMY